MSNITNILGAMVVASLLCGRDAAAQDPRALIVQGAVTMLEQADECVWDKADPSNPARSLGADCLVGIADTAFGGQAPAAIRTSLSKKGPSTGAAWCGMFALGAIRQGVPTVGPWVLGPGLSGVKGIRQISRAELGPGDVCYVGGQYQHYALVVEVDAETGPFSTIEGNADCNGSNSTICAKTRSSCVGYYTAL